MYLRLCNKYPRHCEERSDAAISWLNLSIWEPVGPPVSCCGTRQKLRPAKQACFLPTAATRSGRFIRHRRRSHRSPSRTQKLSSCTPTILGGRLPGKIGNANTRPHYESRRFSFSIEIYKKQVRLSRRLYD